ncbi:MAG: metallophosphatase family protein [Cystobacterineae bacterium]|nr:metallophosphatase family protein [Cystobacterineae bacterium]
MRIAIIADIHGNFIACEAVMKDIRRQAPDLIVAAGDLALRGPHPTESVDLVFSECQHVLIGNTDAYLAERYIRGAYQEQAHWKTELLQWTREKLGPERLNKMAQLPFSLSLMPYLGQSIFICHANPRNLEDSLEPTLPEAALRYYLEGIRARVIVFGHLHFPYRRRVGSSLLIDVGSTGLQRDGDWRASYGLVTFTPTSRKVQIRRVKYPVRQATQALTGRSVPGARMLAQKLLEARYQKHLEFLYAARRFLGMAPSRLPEPKEALQTLKTTKNNALPPPHHPHKPQP